MPSRRKFIESQGATCRSWAWSWAFVNHAVKTVIFGAWDINTNGGVAKILDEAWAVSATGRRNAAYPEALEYIKLAQVAEYRLLTFPMLHAARNPSSGPGPAKILGFSPQLTESAVFKFGSMWYSVPKSSAPSIPEEISSPGTYQEGVAKTVLVNAYERSAQARAACITHYGAKCHVCTFEFSSKYGAIGEGYIHVHHLRPLASIGQEYTLNPIEDLRPVCPNCHAMLHSKVPPLTVDELRKHMRLADDA